MNCILTCIIGKRIVGSSLLTARSYASQVIRANCSSAFEDSVHSEQVVGIIYCCMSHCTKSTRRFFNNSFNLKFFDTADSKHIMVFHFLLRRVKAALIVHSMFLSKVPLNLSGLDRKICFTFSIYVFVAEY